MTEGWRLTLRAPPPLPIEVGALNPETLARLSTAELERMPLPRGRRTLLLAEIFRVEGGPGPRLTFAGPCERLDGIGRGLASGEILVEGDAGHETGAGQSAGEIRITGSVGDLAAMGMRGGILGIAGNAGSFLGAPAPGERLGMRGGLLTVGGTVGARAGDRMRRGTILIAGDAGAGCGARMVAGTIVVAGRLGPLPGLRMRRGTILAAGAANGRADLTIFKLLLRRLGPAVPWLERLLSAVPLRRAAGDLAVDGKGEILLVEG